MSSAELKAAVQAETGAVDPPPVDTVDEDEDGPTVQAAVSPEVANAPPRPSAPRPSAKAPVPPAPVTLASHQAPPAEEEFDSITATAPRIEAGQMSISVPGNVEIRTLEGSEEDEEIRTEVKTMAGADGGARAAVVGAAQVPPPGEEQEEAEDDPATVSTQAPSPTGGTIPKTTASPLGDDEPADDDPATVTTQAPAPKVGSVPDLGDMSSVSISSKSLLEPQTLPGGAQARAGELPTKPGVDAREAPTKSGVTGAPDTEAEYDAEASITSRALAQQSAADDYADDSVTTQAPLGPAAAGVVGVRVNDDTDATTQKKPKPPASPADEEAESITTQAPGHLTNMLRVIASDVARQKSSGALPVAEAVQPIEDDEPPENKTAVMPNAPLKGAANAMMQKHGTLQGMGPASPPSGRPAAISPLGGGLSAAALLHPGSESGLRVARNDPTSGEHASLSALVGVHPVDRASVGRVGIDSQQGGFPHAGPQPSLFPLTPGPGDIEPIPKAPRYGLLVAVVAAISVIVPVSLYVFLNRGEEAPVVHVPAQPSSDVVKRDDPVRGKAPHSRHHRR
jgi:hypothetical protein